MSRALLALAAGVAAAGVATGCAASAAPASSQRRIPRTASAGVHHYEYVVVDQAVYVYDIDHRFRLVQTIGLPGVTGVRGVAASIPDHILYVSHGEDAGPGSTGHLLAYDLISGTVLWDRSYPTGIDSPAVSADGSRIYMPDGELSPDGVWNVLDARTGSPTGSIDAGTGPHNTVMGLSGAYVYLGGRNYDYLDVASTATDRVVRQIGPLKSGVRPFTVNGRETLAYTTATGFLGFQVSSVTTGKVLYTKSFGSYDSSSFTASAPSHGISLSPDEHQLWVMDGPHSQVRVYGVGGVPRHAPRLLAIVNLPHPMIGTKSSCSYDCTRDGWLQHSLNGCYVFVGDAGDVLSVRRRRAVAYLPAMRNSRVMIEIDWHKGSPAATSTRTGLGYASSSAPAKALRCP